MIIEKKKNFATRFEDFSISSEVMKFVNNPFCVNVEADFVLKGKELVLWALTDGRGCQAWCQMHIRSNLLFSILIKDTWTCSSAQLGGGI